jgi:hypothetical protein
MKYCTEWKILTFTPEFEHIDIVKEKCFRDKNLLIREKKCQIN